MASRWLPNIEEFFSSFFRVLIDGGNLMNVEDDRADFFARRVDEHEQTVRTLTAIVLKSHRLSISNAAPQNCAFAARLSSLFSGPFPTWDMAEDKRP